MATAQLHFNNDKISRSIASNLLPENEICYDLIAGQNITAGEVCIYNDTSNVIVTYKTYDEWLISETHLWIGTDLEDMPTTKVGNPKIGNFPYKEENVNLNISTLIIPYSEIGDISCDTTLFIAAHASIEKEIDSGSVQQETAWSQGKEITSGKSWAMYSEYQIECDPDVPPEPVQCETSFAKGESTLIDIGLTDSRWGWEIGPIGPGNYQYPIYAGAAQNDISKGEYVGTLEIFYDGSSVSVTYQALTNYVFTETQLYVGTTHSTTIAPGLYGNIHDQLGGVTNDSFIVDGFNGEAIYIIAHAVSCPVSDI